MKILYFFLLILLGLSSCTLPPLLCFLSFTGQEKVYEFDFPKEELKNKIVEAYTYDKSILAKNFGLTLIQNEDINSEYRRSISVWLDKSNWDEFATEIRVNTPDTLRLLIGKHHSRKEISILAVIDGNESKSSLTLSDIKYQRTRACNRDQEYYRIRVSNRIDRKLIRKLE
ncbi:MAG: hypothetical protein AAFY36_04800 [Bacteroidota bacterium]